MAGDSAYINTTHSVKKLMDSLSGDEKNGAAIVLKSLEAPISQICGNAGFDRGVVVYQLKDVKSGMGYDATNEKIVDMVEASIIDPTKVARVAL